MIVPLLQAVRGDTTYDVHFEGRGGGGAKTKNEMLSDVGGGGLTSVLDVQSLFFLLKKIGFPP